MDNIKSKIPKIDPKMLLDKCHGIRGYIIKTLEKLDIKALIIGIITVIAIYLLIFIYVSISAPSTIKELESKLTTETYPIDYVEHGKNNTDVENNNHANINAGSSSPITAPKIIEGLFEETPYGKIPIIRKSDNLTSFRAYQRPFTFPENNSKPIISFALLDYGLSKEQSKNALDLLPPEVSFILSPYSDLPNEWIKMAQDKGHEIWLNIPIQNDKFSDSGKRTIYHHSTLVKKLKSLRQTLASAQGYVGVSSYSDNGIKTAKEDYSNIAKEIYSRGLGYFETNPDATNIIKNKAFALSAPYINADLQIINIRGKNSFITLETAAKEKGHVVALIPNYPKTVKNLAVWIMKVAQADYVIAPVSAIYDLPLHQKNQQ